MQGVRLAIVTNSAVGWRTVRQRWEQDLSEYRPMLFHIEDHQRRLVALTQRYGGRSLGQALAGRAAVRRAIAAGANVVLLTTTLNAPLLPADKRARYLIYGDATTTQLAELYSGKKLGFPGSQVTRQLRRIANGQTLFLCMSAWYRDALQAELNVSADRLVLLPFYIDIEKWRPAPTEDRDRRPLRALFIGGDLRRKGGDIVYAVAAMERFRDVEFHVVSPHAVPASPNVAAHRELAPDSEALVRLVQSCDIMILPTRADASSLAAVECAACGVPTIITRVGGTAEIVLDETTGSVVAAANIDLFADALEKYRSNRDLLRTHGANARRHVEQNFSRLRHMTILRAAIAGAD
jgi:glycosyltransferase involved in cell wall biosynthesis